MTSVWPFEIDKVEEWAYMEQVFSKEECNHIINLGKEAVLKKARIIGDETDIDKIRDSYVSWLYPNKELDIYYRKLTDSIMELNNNYFKFDLYGFVEGLQFTYYKAPGGFYGKHVDRGCHGITRKLSAVIQLSDPSEYEGGELLLHIASEPIKIPKKIGYLTVFPSFHLHEVAPVIKGERYSLVGWITGPNFK